MYRTCCSGVSRFVGQYSAFCRDRRLRESRSRQKTERELSPDSPTVTLCPFMLDQCMTAGVSEPSLQSGTLVRTKGTVQMGL